MEFVPLPAPSAEEVRTLTERIAARITKRVRKLVEEEEAGGTRLEEAALSLDSSLLAAMRVPVPDWRLLFGDGDHESESTGSDGAGSASARRPRLCAKVAGFFLHAGRKVDATDREGLERLCAWTHYDALLCVKCGGKRNAIVSVAMERSWGAPRGRSRPNAAVPAEVPAHTIRAIEMCRKLSVSK